MKTVDVGGVEAAVGMGCRRGLACPRRVEEEDGGLVLQTLAHSCSSLRTLEQCTATVLLTSSFSCDGGPFCSDAKAMLLTAW
jgi:hypothetical protein